ncbi:hypothetical protein DFH09DRAFT_1285013 [Mycena vulgaris]|nr:hypothetical protein DFH09DRAFT_1285013 [Mycena vulgaris]
MSAAKCSKCRTVDGGDSRAAEQFALDIALGTRHHRLLTTNEPPEISDMPFVQSIVSKTGARLASLETEISRLRDQLKQLEEEQTLLSRYRAQNQAILSPLRRTPPEVLAEMFSWTLPSVRDVQERRRFHMTDSPWLLTHISRRWRAVAVSTPSLWSLLVIAWARQSMYPVSIAKLQLERARTIKLQFFGRKTRDPRAQIEMFQYLAEYSPRWEELRITVTSDLLPLLASLHDRLPSLRRLFIQSVDSNGTSGAQIIDCFHNAPSLVDTSIITPSVSVPLPAHQLTRYYLVGTWDMHRTILKFAPNLVQARVDITPEEPLTNASETIDLLHLRRLYVSRTGVLNYLKAPTLQEIIIYRTPHDDQTHLAHLDAFVGRSGCAIRRLALRGFPNADTASDILQKHPSVTEFAVIINKPASGAPYDFVNSLISRLMFPNPTGGTAISPQLSAIYFGCQGSSYIDYSLYHSMLKSRWQAEGCSLKRSALLTEWGQKPDAATLTGLNVLRQDGLEISMLEGKEASEDIHDWTYVPRWI